MFHKCQTVAIQDIKKRFKLQYPILYVEFEDENKDGQIN